jgi:hypothetical protein
MRREGGWLFSQVITESHHIIQVEKFHKSLENHRKDIGEIKNLHTFASNAF